MPPIDKIELSSAHTGRKMVLTVVFLAIAVAAFVYGFMQLVRDDTGWQQITALSTENVSCADEFVLYYELGAGETKGKEEKRALAALYTDAAVTAYQLFDSGTLYPDRVNVAWLNQHPNETTQVDPGLYKALEQVQASGVRTLYLAPVYDYYNAIFTCQEDAQMAELDPRQDDEIRQLYAECAAYARDPAAVDVELLGDEQVRLKVSEAYLAFAQEHETNFIDFYWMKNAFIADYLADRLAENGYTRGALSSYDGFSRNLADQEAGQFGFNIYDRADGQPLQAATLVYSGRMSIVYLRSYPMNGMDSWHYYQLADGQVRSAYLDTADGMCRSAIDDLVGCSAEKTCGQVLLELIPVFITDQFRPEALDALAEEGTYAVYCQDRTVIATSGAVELTGLYETDEVQYTARIPDK